ncbi:uncharacterized protein LOC107620510 [Arachis ipaensis]|uniref:uncharacterized protein LOC107620510 n=1 Tax=Arachis ipaensis TaxID=130454 RepID=UPI0007AF4D86|nr:uncharacterized protein LOC107620510 [Arachis ipaensis]XP_025684985.1 uncharacterized protein LOC112785768 [Arachis hypogaea]
MATLIEVLSRLTLPPSNNNQNISQPSSSSGIPSQPLPNPKGSLNAITLRSGTILEERIHKNSTEKEEAHEEDIVEIKDMGEEEVHEVVDEEKEQAKAKDSEKKDDVEEAIPIPFLIIAKKAK